MRASHLTGDLKLIAEQVGAWAAFQPELARLWLFGSRAGSENPGGSDLDIAFELEPLATNAVAGGEPRTTWAAEVSLAIGLEVQFQPIQDAQIQDAVTDHGILIYERAGSPPAQWLGR